MRLFLAAVLAGCASATDSPPVVSTADSAADEDTLDVVDDTTPTETPRNPAGDCPACEATKCRAELDACGKDSACVNWLLCMNECFRKTGASACQQKCIDSAKSPRAEAMTACKRKSCVEACTPLD